MAARAQFSNKFGDAILVLEATTENPGDIEEEFSRAAMGLFGPDVASELVDKLGDFAIPTTAGAVALVQREMGGQVVSDHTDTDVFNFPTNNPQPDPSMSARGFIADRYAKWWHNTKFSMAPKCQCQTNNQGSLALVIGPKKANPNETYKGWFCANTFGRGKSAGCPAVFNNSYPDV